MQVNNNKNKNTHNCCGHGHGHDHNHNHDHSCNCNCNHERHQQHEHHAHHDKDSCPVCSGTHKTSPEEYLQRIEESIAKVPRQNKKDRKNKLILLTAGTAAAAAEHNDTAMLQIAEVFLVLRLAEESGQTIAPEDAVQLFRRISGMVGLALTAKYGLEGLTKVNFTDSNSPGTASLVFINCYSIGKVLNHYFKLLAKGSELSGEEAREIFRTAKVQAERLAQ